MEADVRGERAVEVDGGGVKTDAYGHAEPASAGWTDGRRAEEGVGGTQLMDETEGDGTGLDAAAGDSQSEGGGGRGVRGNQSW